MNKYFYGRILLILLSFTISIMSMICVLSLLQSLNATSIEVFLVSIMFIVFSIGLSVSYEMFKSLRYDMKRVKIQRDLDTERAFRTMGDDR